MVIKCEDVWREISNYLDDEVEPGLRAAMDAHIRGCQRCTAVLDGTRNVIHLYADERMLEVPLGFSRRLHRRLGASADGSRRNFFGWMIAAAAGVLIFGGIEFARSSVSGGPGQRSQMARSSGLVPPDMMVVVAEDGELFHLAGCSFIHDKARLRTISAREAMREGYTPCVRCMKKYLGGALLSRRNTPPGRSG